jgi:hypothetical protein
MGKLERNAIPVIVVGTSKTVPEVVIKKRGCAEPKDGDSRHLTATTSAIQKADTKSVWP